MTQQQLARTRQPVFTPDDFRAQLYIVARDKAIELTARVELAVGQKRVQLTVIRCGIPDNAALFDRPVGGDELVAFPTNHRSGYPMPAVGPHDVLTLENQGYWGR